MMRANQAILRGEASATRVVLRAVGAILICAVSGCAPTIADFQKRCLEIGFAADTPEMRDCVLQQDIAQQMRSATIASGALSRPHPSGYFHRW